MALGECMVRLSPPGHGRLEFARSLEIDVGGGEYNAAYAAARLGWRTAFASKLPDNPLADIVLNHARATGMDVSHVALEPHDGLGRVNRVGLYFAEIGVGVRGGMALFDRGHSSASQMAPTDVDWSAVFQQEGVRLLHSGGIFAVLSESTRATLQAAVGHPGARGGNQPGVRRAKRRAHRQSGRVPGLAAFGRPGSAIRHSRPGGCRE
jgi:2-dehydro-3-deoxygluconokinase